MMNVKIKGKGKGKIVTPCPEGIYKDNASILPLIINLATRWEMNESWTKVI